MIPRSITRNLAGLRRRERLLRLAWGAARWLALVLALLLVCAFVDWLVDRDQDTPWGLRYALFGLQIAVAVIAAFVFLLRPQLRRLTDDRLALFVEDRLPRFGHRLISAVQLNRPGAATDGMSPALIAAVTREAEREADTTSFARLADHRRLGWAAAVAVPVLLLAAVPLLLWPETASALLARQALADVEIPHAVHLEDLTAEVWPSGDRVKLLYRATGPDLDDLIGEVTVTPDGQPRDRYPLTMLSQGRDGEAVFGVELPPGSLDFVTTARLGDGRTRKPSRVRYVPRPIITSQDAWVQLPAFCGVRPNGGRYEVPQGRGDVAGIPGSAARVALKIQKPVVAAQLEIFGPADYDPKKADDEQGPPVVKRTVTLALAADGREAHGTFDLRPDETSYRMVVTDEYGFANVPPPRRSVRLVPEEPPQVVLLRDTFGSAADSDVEGMPVPLGGPVRVPFVAHGPYGLGQARVLYRVLKKRESGNEVVEEDPWVVLPLPEVVPNDDSGPFDPKRGVFATTPFDHAVPFHAVPSPDPMHLLGRTLGGGRPFLHTKGLTGPAGAPLKVHVGDQIEYCVEVFADKNPAAGRPSARSETRVTTVVTWDQFWAWSQSVADEENRIRKLDAQQRGVFSVER